MCFGWQARNDIGTERCSIEAGYKRTCLQFLNILWIHFMTQNYMNFVMQQQMIFTVPLNERTRSGDQEGYYTLEWLNKNGNQADYTLEWLNKKWWSGTIEQEVVIRQTTNWLILSLMPTCSGNWRCRLKTRLQNTCSPEDKTSEHAVPKTRLQSTCGPEDQTPEHMCILQTYPLFRDGESLQPTAAPLHTEPYSRREVCG